MGRHRNQIARFSSRGPQNAERRFAEREFGFHLNPARAQILSHRFKICAVVFHLLGIRELKTIVISRRPSIGDVEQEQLEPCTFASSLIGDSIA